MASMFSNKGGKGRNKAKLASARLDTARRPVASQPLALTLEQRFMFDAAGVATAADAVMHDTGADAHFDTADHSVDQQLLDAAAQVSEPASSETAPAASAANMTQPQDEVRLPSDTLQQVQLALSADTGVAPADIAPPDGARQEIVFIDTGLTDWQVLSDNVRPGVEIVRIDPAQDGLTQVATALEGRSGVDAIHIVSHGQEARLLIGTTSLDQGSISGYSETLATIGQALDADGDILLYGCDIGSGDNGLDFITSLGQSTAADIAASVDLTGNPELGGDWSLELSAGEVDSRSAITGDAVAGYTGLLAADNAPVLTVGTITTYAAGSAAHVVAPDLTVAGDNSLITNARVTVTNYAAGDVLGVTGMHGVTGSQANGVLTLTGSATAAQWQEVLRTVTFQSSGANEAPDRAIRFDLGTQRKHHYEYVGAAGITWNSAMTAAANRQYNGMQGYLATITSAGENAAVAALVPGDAWIGATDNYSDINTAVGGTVFANQGAAEGRWYWAAGPEKGQQFWQGGANGGVVNGGYAGWPSGIEPNNKGGNENYALTSVSGHWNDLDNINRNGYVVEYGGLGNDPALVSQTITQVVNDAPVAVNDSGSATEAGTAAGSNATGNLLSNDTHDPSTALTVTAVRLGAGQAVGTAGTIGQGLVGSYGSLTLNADGGYTYAPDNDNAAVQALAAGETLLERFTYTVADGGGLTDTAVLTVTINGANDAPTATASVMPSLPGTAAFIEGTAVIIAPDAVLSDVDSDNLSAVTVTLNAVPDGTAEILSVTGLPTGISTAGYDAATRTLTLTGAASVADYQAALRLVKYNNTSDVPTTSDRSISIIATDRAHAVSAATTVTVTVTAVNDAPVAVNDTGSATEAGGAANGTGGGERHRQRSVERH